MATNPPPTAQTGAFIPDELVDVDTIEQNDVRKLNIPETTSVWKSVNDALKAKNINVDPAHMKAFTGMVLYRLAVRTTSRKVDDTLPGKVCFSVNKVKYDIPDVLIISAIEKDPVLVGRVNKLRVFCRSNEEDYLQFCRNYKHLQFPARSVKMALPESYRYLCADFLTGEHLNDVERSALHFANEVMLKSETKSSDPIVSVKHYGKFTH